jgi:hypothetical protein
MIFYIAWNKSTIFISRYQQRSLHFETNNSPIGAHLRLKGHQARWIRQQFSEHQHADRMTFSRDVLQMMKDLSPRQQNCLITSDETWICWHNNYRLMWAQEREDVPANAKKMVSSRKTMLSGYFTRTGFVSIELLPQGQQESVIYSSF